MSFFENASGFNIEEAHFNEVTVNNQTTITQENREASLSSLLRYVAPGASHDSKAQYAAPKCAPETRVQLLKDILEWVEVPEKETGIMFLKGPAGAGKSCIARSVCEQSAAKGWLGASFFFWRSSSARSNESQLITTLAYQLAEYNEELKKFILAVVAEHPRIIEMPMDVQFRKLILEPCLKVPREQLAMKVIVIDGLDECNGEMAQISILQLLAKAVRHEHFPLALFVTSRPELHLQETLDTKEVIFATNVISLDGIPGVSQDIRTVLQSGFNSIQNNPRFRKALRSVTRPWPPADNIEKLVERSSGQFIYAATVLKFISSPDHNPTSQLEIVLGIRASNGVSPLEDLDLLYHEIMSRAREPERTMKVLSYVLAIQAVGRKRKFNSRFSKEILKAVLHNQNRLLTVIEQLLGLSDGEACLALNQLHSLIAVNAQSTSNRRKLEIKFYHKSYQDFLNQESRSKTFYIDVNLTHISIANSCLKYLRRDTCYTTEECVAWLYSIFHWHTHDRISPGSINTQLMHTAFLDIESMQVNSVNLIKAFDNLALVPSICGLYHTVVDIWETVKPLEFNDSISTEFRDRQSFLERALFPTWKIFLNAYKDDPPKKRALFKEFLKEFGDNHPKAISTIHFFSIWTIYFKTYGNDPLIKKLLLLCSVAADEIHISQSDLGKMNLECSGGVNVLQQYDELKFLLSQNVKDLCLFLSKSEYSEPFYSSQKDYENLFSFFVSTELWHKYPESYINLWQWDTKNFTKSNLVECFTTANLEPYEASRNTLSLDDLFDMALYIYLKMPTTPEAIDNRATFEQLCIYPIWCRILGTYSDVPLTKQLLLLCNVMNVYHLHRSDTVTWVLLESYCIPNLSDDNQTLRQFIKLLYHLSHLGVSYFTNFLACTEHPYHCTANDYTECITAIIDSRVWPKRIAHLCQHWNSLLIDHRQIIAITPKLLASLSNSAINFRDDSELILILDPDMEVALVRWLTTLLGPSHDVIEVWKETFDKAHSVNPEKFGQI